MAHSKIQWDVEEKNKSCPKENTKLTYCASLYFSTHSGLGKSQSVIRQETKDPFTPLPDGTARIKMICVLKNQAARIKFVVEITCRASITAWSD